MSDAFRTNRRRVIVAVQVYLRARAGVKPFFDAGRDTWQFMFIQRAENDYAPYSGLGHTCRGSIEFSPPSFP
jgi:hypothetical protein